MQRTWLPPVGGHCSLSLTEILFDTQGIQKTSGSRNATDTRSDAQDVPMDEDSASDKDGDGYAAAESSSF